MGSQGNVALTATGIRDRSLQNRWNSAAPHNYLSVTQAVVSAGVRIAARSVLEPHLENDVSSRLGRRVRALRLERNLTQTDMARRFGIDRSYISDLERGKKSVSLPMLEVIALGMNITLAELFDSI